MGKYNEFLAHFPKKRQYEQANREWNILTKEPLKFDEKFKEKMTELKVLQIDAKGKNFKSFSQTKLNFDRATESTIQSPKIENNVKLQP